MDPEITKTNESKEEEELKVAVCDVEAHKMAPSTWMIVVGVISMILYVLFVVYLTIVLSSMGRQEIVILTIISAINLPILGPVIIWIFLISGQISKSEKAITIIEPS
jgi:hypothetical protein